MRILALDIGTRRTGVAFVDDQNGIPLPLDTIVADSMEEMVERVMTIYRDRKIDVLVIGLPLLPSGDEGSQAQYVHGCIVEFEQQEADVELLDERYTTRHSSDFDGDARAACQLLTTYIQRKQQK